MRCLRADWRSAWRATFCAGRIASAAMCFKARFSVACTSARVASSLASSETIRRIAAARAPASSVSSAARCEAKRETTAVIEAEWRALKAASMASSAFWRAARWLATRSAISAAPTARRAALALTCRRWRYRLSGSALRFSGALWLGLSRGPVTGPVPSPCHGPDPPNRRGLRLRAALAR